MDLVSVTVLRGIYLKYCVYFNSFNTYMIRTLFSDLTYRENIRWEMVTDLPIIITIKEKSKTSKLIELVD